MIQSLQFESLEDPAGDLQEELWERLREHGRGKLSNPALAEHASLAILAREDGVLRAGLLALTYFQGMNLQCLWIDQSWRGRRLGSHMLGLAEEAARERHCNVIFGHSFGFQARDFYVKHGYEVFGVIPEYPPGHGCSFLKKSLA
ncbi:MAG: GNAT family N-acetyltransferase [Leptospirales bacterium]|nr:GNAT family N-acetyltransferase [Leptospirales bacterium]